MTHALNNKMPLRFRTGEFKRPDHFDFMTTEELKKAEFSGIRVNNLSQAVEIWTLGDIRASVSAQDIALDPDAVDKKFREVFAFEETQTFKEKR